MNHEEYMNRCIELASLGKKHAAPNPMVGSIIVHEGRIIGEGYHRKCGEAHAEVNAINSVKDKSLLPKSTIYVSLEPCAHYGRTPPCSKLIIDSGIKHVVIATVDPFAQVKGKGIEMLKEAGCKVEIGILEHNAQLLNKRFFTYHNKKRPFVFLKWAESLDGLIDKKRIKSNQPPTPISNKDVKTLVHKIRTEEGAILVGKNTALLDNPMLNARLVSGKNPIRLVVDQDLTLPNDLNIFDKSIKTVVFNNLQSKKENNLYLVQLNFQQPLPQQILDYLYSIEVTSLIVEGGTNLLQQFISENQWDEAYVISSPKRLEKGIKAPIVSGKSKESITLGTNIIKIISNEN